MIYSVFRILWYDKLLFLKNRLQSYEKKIIYASAHVIIFLFCAIFLRIGLNFLLSDLQFSKIICIFAPKLQFYGHIDYCASL